MIGTFEPSRNGHTQGREKATNLLDAALAYHRRGWCVIPTKGKKPACQWKQFQNDRPSQDELRELFRRAGVTGLAVILGDVSGGLACRDFDDLGSYEKWAAEYPRLAKRLPTVRTARGYHVYFRGHSRFKPFDDGEYRAGSGCYCVLPPSRHPDGPIYTWVVPLPDGELPAIDPRKSGLMAGGTGETQRTQDVVLSGGSMYSGSAVSSGGSVSSVFPAFPGLDEEEQQAVQDSIVATLPEAEGQRSRRLFDLCRSLKAIPSLASAEPATLRPIVQEWHRRALPIIRTKPFSETWADFLSGWDKVKSAAGRGPVDDAFRRANDAEPPKKAARLYPDEPRVVLLAALCRELQRDAGENNFFLACRTAAQLLGVTHKQAWCWLRVLCADGILECTEVGTHPDHRASQYRYVAWTTRGKGAK